MDRNGVDNDRHRTCSSGLHFCSKEYFSYYGSSRHENDRCVLVKIDPSDVVSIPSDYNNAKGRTCRYQVLGEMTEGWREALTNTDFTYRAIVSNKHLEQLTQKVTAVNEVIDDDEDLKTGYLLGWEDAKKKSPANPDMTNSEMMIQGYKQGYKDKKNHKAKKFK